MVGTDAFKKQARACVFLCVCLCVWGDVGVLPSRAVVGTDAFKKQVCARARVCVRACVGAEVVGADAFKKQLCVCAHVWQCVCPCVCMSDVGCREARGWCRARRWWAQTRSRSR